MLAPPPLHTQKIPRPPPLTTTPHRMFPPRALKDPDEVVQITLWVATADLAVSNTSATLTILDDGDQLIYFAGNVPTTAQRSGTWGKSVAPELSFNENSA